MRAMRAQLFVAVFSAFLVTGPAYGQGKWSSLKPIPQGEEEVYGTAAGGKLYVLGGLGVFSGWEPKRMLWSFDPATSEWTRLQNLRLYDRPTANGIAGLGAQQVGMDL